MALINRKISTYAKDVSNLSNTPNDDGITAEQLKAIFMGAAKEEIKTSVNGIVDDLVATTDGASGADQIGATPLKIEGATTVQGQLAEIKTDFSIGMAIADSLIVHKSQDETITGIKTFSASPIVPIPETDYQVAPKKYADDTFVPTTDYVRAHGYVLYPDSGTPDRYAVTLDPTPALNEFGSFYDGMMFTFQVGEYNDNLTDTPTINVNGHGDTGIFKSTRINQSIQIPLKPGDLRGAGFYTLLYYQGSFYVIAGDHDAEKLGGQLPAYYAADSSSVHTSGAETINDVKTFLDSPLIPTPTEELGAANKAYVDTKDATAMHKTEDETVSGVKAFSNSPTVPTPIADTQAAPKKYVDDQLEELASGVVEYFVAKNDYTRINSIWQDTGTANDIVITPNPAISDIADGMRFMVIMEYTNTSEYVTIAINGLGPYDVFKSGDDSSSARMLEIGELGAGVMYDFVYNGDDTFRVMIPDDKSKVDISSIVNDLTTGGTDRPLSAEQGKIATSITDVATSKTYTRSLKAENDHLVLTLSEIV